MEGPATTEPPLAKLHRFLPVAASRAYMEPDREPAYITPLATLTEPGSNEPEMGSGVCQSSLPVKTSSAEAEVERQGCIEVVVGRGAFGGV
jgi:hypothetical protein